MKKYSADDVLLQASPETLLRFGACFMARDIKMEIDWETLKYREKW